ISYPITLKKISSQIKSKKPSCFIILSYLFTIMISFESLLTLYHTTECILPYKGGRKCVPSRLDRWHGKQGSAWKQCGSTSARACWRNRRDGPRVIVSTRSRWSRVSTLLSAHK